MQYKAAKNEVQNMQTYFGQGLVEIEIEIVYNITSKNRLSSLGPPFCYAIQDLEARGRP
jgi:hypothetical protein